MTCQLKLKAEGKPYPRTCSDCGLGPCKEGYSVKPHKLIQRAWLVTGENGKQIVTLSPERAAFFVKLMGGTSNEVLVDTSED